MKTQQIDTTLAAMIDHTLLKPDAGENDILRLCDESRVYGFASVCVNPSWVRLCSNVLRESTSSVCTVIGFPLGSNRTEVKVREAEMAIQDGAVEFDMVLHVGRLKQGDAAYVEHDIAAVTEAVKAASEKYIVKVILETCLLSADEIRNASAIVRNTGADFVKTSTGFSSGGATVDSVRLMRAVVGEGFGVKASGGIRNRQTAIQMIEAGANRIGASSSIEIVST
ncbi:MAG: deoxyribose-phosphate aldolase [Bacteroidetes bacterium]|nr:deoxyribose-phosphate aldolase [Bacteroidota bacterium]